MAFISFDELALAGLRTTRMGKSKILIKTEFKDKGRPQTVFRFSDEVIEKAGWKAGEHRIGLSIDWSERTIRAQKVTNGGYKLSGHATSRAIIKFTAAPLMPIVDQPCEIMDAIVTSGEIIFVLPPTVRESK